MLHRAARLVLTLVFVAGGPACATPASPDPAGSSGTVSAATPASNVASSLVDLTNSERRRTGLARLSPNARLMQAAQIQAAQNARVGRLEHVSSGQPYPRVEDRLAAAGYKWQSYGENLAYGQSSPSAVVQSWMGSSGHRSNILSSSFTEIGIGYAEDSAGRPYYAQVFGRPAS